MAGAAAWALAAGGAQAASVNAVALLSQINNIVLNNLTANAETEGTIYVGGAYTGGATVNPDGLASFTVGDATGSLVIGGASAGNPNVNNGEVVIGGSNAGSIVSNAPGGSNSITVGGANSGFIQTAQPSTISIGGANSGTLNPQGGTAQTNTGVIPIIPVAEMTGAFRALSLELGALATTDGVVVNASDQNMLSVLSGSERFAVAHAPLALVAGGTFLGVTQFAGQTTIINVAGQTVTVGANMNIDLPNVLFNFYEATSLTVNVGWGASILAPFANVTLNGGGVNGTVVSFDLTQNAEVRPYNDSFLFSGDFPEDKTTPPPPPSPVPLPAAAWMLLAGLCGLAALGRRRAA
jgi:choice-of-anchor A domain-containing protein